MLEMHEVALNYTCRLAVDLLSGSGFRCFFFEGWGNPVRVPIWRAARTLSEAGFCFAYNDGLFTILIRRDSERASAAYHLPNPGAAEGEGAFHPPIFINRESTLSHQIDAGRDSVKRAGRYSVEDYDRMLKDILGSEDVLTNDERFAEYYLGASKC
jgi:hypothetical protein